MSQVGALYQALAFVVCSVSVVYVSRASLRAPGSHGFYRFFAWELILALVLLSETRQIPRRGPAASALVFVFNEMVAVSR